MNIARIGIVIPIAAMVVIIALASTAVWQTTVQAQSQDPASPAGICGRTQRVQTAILAELAAVSDCALVVESDLNGITGTLEFYNTSILGIQSGDFDGLQNLENLSLGQNQITVLPEDVFDGLDNLKYLDLGGNQISVLPEDVFDDLDNLKYLYLGGNPISVLPEDVFDGLDNLIILLFGSSQISALPEDVFDGLDSLEELNLGANQISVLPEDVFDGLNSLEELNLGANQISVLPEDVFDGLNNLTILTLGYNQISALPEDMFDGLSSLKRLYMDDNPGSSFIFKAELEGAGADAVVVKVAEGAPFSMSVTLSANGGTLSANTVTIAGGSIQSPPVTVTPESQGQSRVTVSIDSAAFSATATSEDDDGYSYTGIQTGRGESLVLGNSPATGLPTISGTAQVGQTLTADTSGIADSDGLTSVTFTYQWLSSRDTEIDGATSSTYSLQFSQEGKAIKVRVSFTDDAGNAETLTSAATAAVTSSEPEAQVPGAPQNLRAATGNSGELAVSWDAPSSDGGSEITGYRVQWKESSGSWDTPSDVSETTVTGTAHTITGLTDGTEYSVQVRAVNSKGAGEASPEAAATPVNPTPLTAEFLDIPESHDGSNAFTFELRFSENIEGLSYTTLQEHAFTVTGGSVSNVRRLEPGKNVRWEITVQPSSEAEVTITLNATTDCTVEGAICTSDSRMLSGGLELVVPGPPSNSAATGAPTVSGTAQVGQTLTADTSGIADSDGLTSVTFTYQWLSSRDTEIDGATSSTYSLQFSQEGKAIKVRVSFTDDAGNAETLTSAATAAVARPPLTATVHDKPSSHDGSNAFTFELRFSEDIEDLSYTTLEEHAFTVTGGSVSNVRRQEPGKNVRWEITIQPSSNADVTIVLPITTDCTAQGAICTSDGRKLSSRVELTISGPSE